MADAAKSPENGRWANVSLAASMLLYGYVIVAVLKQSDVELVLPSSVFDLGGLLDKVKDGVPGGSFVSPLLQIKIPLYLFYTAGPVFLLALHAFLVGDPRLLWDAHPILRAMAIWVPPLALALVRWRFAPYTSARPQPPPLAGLAMEQLQTLGLGLDAIPVIFALLHATMSASPVRNEQYGRRVALLRAVRHSGVIWFAVLVGTALPTPAWIGPAVALLLLAGWVLAAPVGSGMFRLSDTGEITVVGRVTLAGFFVVAAALPVFARSLDLSGQTLMAKAPSEALIAALVTSGSTNPLFFLADEQTQRTRLEQRVKLAREAAWTADARGIDFSRWRFQSGHFEHATMAKVRMSGAKLTKATFDYANLILADLRGADLTGASLRYTDLIGAHTSDWPEGTYFAQARARVLLTDALTPDGPTNETDPTAPNCAGKDRANFNDTDFSDADLSRADLGCSLMQRAKMTKNTNLYGTKLPATSLWHANMKEVQTSLPAQASAADPTAQSCAGKQRTDFSGADLTGADLSGADLRCARMQKVTMTKDTKLAGAKLEGVDFCGAHLADVNLGDADGASKASFDYADLQRTTLPGDMRKAYLRHANLAGSRLAPATIDEKPNQRSLAGAFLTDASEEYDPKPQCP
jgi:uncharacterized protein YjbI with pentapeptide repeats